jgi:hypothetical protein
MVLAQTRFLGGVGRVRRQCPLWVISGHVQCKGACLLYPLKRTPITARSFSRLLAQRRHGIGKLYLVW